MLLSLAVIFLIRLLPISYGIHTLLSMIVLFFLGVYYLEFPINKTILSIFFTFIIISVVEIMYMGVLILLYGSDRFIAIMNDSLTRSYAGFPVSVLLFIIMCVLYSIRTKNVPKGD